MDIYVQVFIFRLEQGFNSPHTRYRMREDFCITSYFNLFVQTVLCLLNKAKTIELLSDLPAFNNYKICIFFLLNTVW